MNPESDPEALASLRKRLLVWYERHRRDLPWRRTKDPYAIWVSEIMLQQTRVAAVTERYEAFLQRFPTVTALASAAEEDVLALWSGLGYYRRARMLHKASKVVAVECDAVMPATAAGLRALQGIGAYTSAAIASIAFDEPIAVVDGNVERVVQRLAGLGADSFQGKAELGHQTNRLAGLLLDPLRPGDFNQAMMELGATVCLPKNPKCLVCPVASFCSTRGEHPTRGRAKMSNRDAAYALVIRDHPPAREVLLEQRSSEETVMSGMWELPALRETSFPEEELCMAVRHAIMQVNYNVRIRAVPESDVVDLTEISHRHRWVQLSEVSTLPLTGLARKVLLRAMADKRAPQ
jgi:A/G-specific adenine glycosylase